MSSHRQYGILFFYFFFFQAEDGIRDYKVTGVQTVLFRSRGSGRRRCRPRAARPRPSAPATTGPGPGARTDRKSTRLNSSHLVISYAVFCLKKKKKKHKSITT